MSILLLFVAPFLALLQHLLHGPLHLPNPSEFRSISSFNTPMEANKNPPKSASTAPPQPTDRQLLQYCNPGKSNRGSCCWRLGSRKAPRAGLASSLAASPPQLYHLGFLEMDKKGKQRKRKKEQTQSGFFGSIFKVLGKNKKDICKIPNCFLSLSVNICRESNYCA